MPIRWCDNRTVDRIRFIVLASALACATSSNALRPWAAKRLGCAESQITFTPVGGDCLDKPFSDVAGVASQSDCDVAARGCDRYMKFIHAPGGDWYEVR